MAKNPLQSLHDYGQSVWYDNISRGLLDRGDLQRLVSDDGIRGVTSNPTIFEKAVLETPDYDQEIAAMAHENKTAESIYESLAVADIRHACSILRPVYEESHGADGYVSLEVSPQLAEDSEATIAEAKRLHSLVAQNNLMIKVPATAPGMAAIEHLIADGVSVNVTLIFSLQAYRETVEAYLTGLEQALAQGRDISRIASVASFFVSRVDTLVDKKLESIGTPRAQALRGKAAIANAKLAYAEFARLFSGPRWQRLQNAGALPQRPLWASTSTKNPAYRDVLYVEELIGPYTVDTMPPATVEAFRDHGRVAQTITQGLPEAKQTMSALAEVGIDFNEVTDTLLEEGLASFAKSYHALIAGVAQKVSLV